MPSLKNEGIDAPVGADRSAESGSEFGCLAELPLGRGDLRVCRFMQHFAGEDLIRLDRFVAGSLKFPVGE